MYVIEKSVDRKWHYQARTQSLEEAKKYIKLYGLDQVEVFKTCDCLRAIDQDSKEVIAMYPADFVERE